MANIGNLDGNKIVVDMTGNSDATFYVDITGQLRKHIPNSVQVIGIDLVGASGTFGLRVCNLSQNDEDFSFDYVDSLGDDFDINSNIVSKTYQTPYCYNNIFLKFDGVSGVTGGKFLIVLNAD